MMDELNRFIRQICKIASIPMVMCVCVSVQIVRTGHTLAKIKNVKTFVDFEICHRMVSLRKLYYVTLTYCSKAKDSNRNLPTEANAHTSVTSVSTSVLRTAP